MKFLSYIISGFFALAAFFSSAQNNSLLYKIESPNSKPSYLFGTMHVIPDSAYYFPTKAQKILKHTDQLVLEIGDMDMMKAQKLLRLESGTCFDIFTPSEKDSVIAWGAKTMGASPEVFEAAFGPLKPFALLQLNTKEMMSGDVKYIEMELQKTIPDVPVAGFETIEDQLSIFDDMPKEALAEMVMQMVKDDGSSADKEMKELITAYQKQDIDKLAELINSEEASGTLDTDALLYDRNARWIPKIQEFTKTKSCFIAVGAGHLGGEKGVIKLLKNAGYTVTPIEY